MEIGFWDVVRNGNAFNVFDEVEVKEGEGVVVHCIFFSGSKGEGEGCGRGVAD